MLWPTTDSAKPVQLIRLGDGHKLVLRNADQLFDGRQVTVNFSSLGYSQTYALGLSRVDEAAQLLSRHEKMKTGTGWSSQE